MLDPSLSSLIAGAIGIGLVGSLTAPATLRILRRSTSAKQDPSVLYEDKDGVATEESTKKFRDVIPRTATLVLGLLGLAVAIAAAVWATLHPSASLFLESWLGFGAWAGVVVQLVSLFTEPFSPERVRLGMIAALSSICIIAAIVAENTILIRAVGYSSSLKVHVALNATQVGIALFLIVACLSLPRRPDVYRNGVLVDQQNTVSLLSRFSFAWVHTLLADLKADRKLEIDDLPELPYDNRASSLQSQFESAHDGARSLWKTLILIHWPSLLLVYFLVTILCVIAFLPQFALLQLLRTLEAKARGDVPDAPVWVWVVALGGFLILSSLMEGWVFWAVMSRLWLPFFEQLSAVIFGKSLRRKDIKSASEKKKPDDPNGSAENGHTENGADKKDDKAEEEEDDNSTKSRQSTINLLAVDGKRVAEWATFSYLNISVTLKLVFSIGFLVSLIGWKALVAGLCASLLITPLNIYSTKTYFNLQDALMKLRDKKTAVITEALQGIRQIKFSAFENQWQNRIREIREKELTVLWKSFLADAGLISVWIFGPVMLSAVSLAVYSLVYGQLSASVAFTTISIFSSIELTLAIIPELLTMFLDAKVSHDRIDKFLRSADEDFSHDVAEDIAFVDASICWPLENKEDVSDDNIILRNVNITFPNKELSVISGKTGSGKTLILASILGESEIIKGTLRAPVAPLPQDRFDSKATKDNWILDTAVAYVAQVPWIENATIKENITFGLPLDDDRYQETIRACALEKDFEMLENGDQTDIGANGINLSGGQKWRVSFARALYSRAGIMILDDIFSALDAHVGRHIFEEALTGTLGQGRTRILVTHHVALCLPRTNYAVLVGDGTIQHAGLTEELRQAGKLDQFIEEETEATKQDKEEEEVEPEETIDDGEGLQKVLSRVSAKSGADGQKADQNPDLNPAKPKKFMETETRETGKIKLSIYSEYFKATGGALFWVPVVILYVGYIVLNIGRSWWIKVWTQSYETESESLNASIHTITTQQYLHQGYARIQAATDDDNLRYYLGVYIGLAIVACLVGTGRYLYIYFGSIRASRILFERITFTVLRAPLRWLDTVPVGRILNRFTADFNSLDSRLSMDFGGFLGYALQCLGVLAAGVLVSPLVVVFAVILFGSCLHVANRYLIGARELKRLESNGKSPIFEQFGAALIGVSTIRAFNRAGSYIERMQSKIDRHCRSAWYLNLANRWMSLRLNLIGALFAIAVATLVVSIKGINASLAGFALSFALQISQAVVWSLRAYTNLELDMNAAERIVEYTKLPTEDQGGLDAPAAWPTEGRLEVNDLVVAYAPDLPPVLKGLTFTIEKHQRVGVVGRTGAGKSSLTLALFRFLDARQGSIHIDGVDVSKIKLYDLRSRLAIIPQDPVLFSGTVRSNLDAFDDHTDAELRDALERVHLIAGTGTATPAIQPESSTSGSATGTATPTTAVNIFRDLSSKISEGGLNLSQGQRQLLCLARAIVARPKIMVLDEATSAVDMATDALIQRSIREEFTASTLLVIAHRLSTIADFDRILVLGDGKVEEYASPKELMEIEGGVFRGMVESSGDREELEKTIFGSDATKKE